MQISAIPPTRPAHAAEHQDTQIRADAAKAIAERKVFNPQPQLRPNVQDYVDIDRTLMALRTK